MTTGSIEFKPGDPLEKSFTISITEDSFVEAPEQLEAILTSVDPQAVIGSQGKITVTIIDNDGKERYGKQLGRPFRWYLDIHNSFDDLVLAQ